MKGMYSAPRIAQLYLARLDGLRLSSSLADSPPARGLPAGSFLAIVVLSSASSSFASF